MKFYERWKTTEVKAKNVNKKKVTARIDMSEEVAGKGLCPECKEAMKPVLVNKIPALCCMKCRIVLPMPE